MWLSSSLSAKLMKFFLFIASPDLARLPSRRRMTGSRRACPSFARSRARHGSRFVPPPWSSLRAPAAELHRKPQHRAHGRAPAKGRRPTPFSEADDRTRRFAVVAHRGTERLVLVRKRTYGEAQKRA